jgi:hypothetical protein
MRSAPVLLALAAAVAAENGSFEEGLAGWTLETGAERGDGPEASVEIDREVARDGKASLRFASDGAARRWPMAVQTIDCAAGSRLLLTVAARCRGLRQEAGQFANANAVVIFLDGRGQRLGILGSPALRDDRDWIDLHVHALAPPGTAKARVAVFSSMSGAAWFDDVRVSIASADPNDAAARAVAYEHLRLHIERTYPYFGLRPVDARADANEPDIGKALRAMLAPFEDLHFWIELPGRNVYTVEGNPSPPNWDGSAIRARLTEVLLEKGRHLVGRMGDIGYAALGAWSGEGFGEVEAALDRLADARALILDVRANGGGDERLAQRVAGRFAKEPTVYGRAQARDPTLPGRDGFLPPFDKRIEPAGKPDPRRVIVLQGPYCVSSTEWFLLMMRALDNVTTVGLPSRGATGNPQLFPLFPGIGVRVPSQRGLMLDGKLIERNGVPPEEEVGRGDKGTDAALERAIELLR